MGGKRRAKAMADNIVSGVAGSAYQGIFDGETRIVGVLVEVHGTALHEQEIESRQCGERVGERERFDAQLIAALLGPKGNASRSFERDVFEAEDLHWLCL